MKTSIEKLDSLLTSLIDSTVDGNTICKSLYDYIEGAISKNFQKKESKTSSSFPNNPWFDNECKLYKRRINDFKQLNNIDIEPYRSIFVSLLQEYKRITQNKKRQYKLNDREQLRAFDSDKPSDFWKFWHSFNKNTNNPSSLILHNFENYFTSQVMPTEIDYFDQEHMSQIESFMATYVCIMTTATMLNAMFENTY